MRKLPLCLVLLSTALLHAQATPDKSSHAVQFVTVDRDIKLEVLDWGGTGRPMILLGGLGSTAHDFDTFAPKLSGKYHVYGITRRGFGASSKPAPTVANYNADRLGDDVLAVIAALKLDRPILVGHSIAGEELSSISSRHPEKAAAFIYLDAALPFAYYSHANSDLTMDLVDVDRRIEALKGGAVLDRAYIDGLLTNVTLLEKDLQDRKKLMAITPETNAGPPPPEGTAIMFGQQEFTQLRGPILAISACPPGFDFIRDNPKVKTAMIADVTPRCLAQTKALQDGVPSAKVVLLPNADHDIYRSNESDVVREMNAFLSTVP